MKARILAVFAVLVMSLPANAQLDKISNQDATSGLREALVKGSGAAVDLLGGQDGFFGNQKVKIPLPASLAKIERLMRGVGLGKHADELVLTINRAAEAAMPEAKKMLVDSVRKMSVQDAKGILTGGEDSATQYFKRTTSDQLRAAFLPTVKKATAKVKLAEKYNEYAEKGVKFGLVGKEDANLDNYVTQKALDGLFVMIAEEEKKIRQNPAQAASNIISKVFGALKF
ncbi:MAG: DUF4197 domain-containing protein [Betaproteobacteria bacterium]|nr:DUF4197 domain-containing protein [Betaproteobacteria bacterium]